VRENRANVRIITATNKPLESLVRDGKLRSDLYFRLRIVHLQVPSLRERGDDVLLLVEHFLALHRRRYQKPELEFSPEALAVMRGYAWPGNVRELRNAIEQAVIMARSDVIGPEHLHLTRIDTAMEPALPPTEGVTLVQMERDLVAKALDKANWNVTLAAKLLGISRDTLRYRIEKFQLARHS
jgi:DNA-binding NtrC family response regulator